MAREVIQEAIGAGELPKGADSEIVIDTLHGPQPLCCIMGHARLTKELPESINDIEMS
jgi:hypothetical protein